MKRWWFASCLMMLCLMLGACDPQEKTNSGTKADKATKATGSRGEVVTSREDLESATVRIEAKGTFLDAGTGQQITDDWGGSGFIIDPSGIAVTNNHVVAGAALLQVYVAGEDKPFNAKVLGVSECSDLAVIDIEGEGYPYFEWHDGAINTGIDVYAAGFPLGDPEFTLTRGIVSKAEANGETPWASVDSVLEHDATINPGDSGGPLVGNNSKVVGVNYAGISETNQNYAIKSEKALQVIEQLRHGQNVDSIGVNGEAVLSDDETKSGIWVSSVKAGAPADEAGVRAGDIIRKLEGLVLANDGTMADYCDVLRSREPSDTMNLEVLRSETGEVLEGQLNGRNLELATPLTPGAEKEAAGVSEGGTYFSYTAITDDTGDLKMSVPTEWNAVNGTGWALDRETVGPALSASADLDAYNDTWGEPGVSFGASSSLVQSHSVDSMLDDHNYAQACEKDARYDYQDPPYTGKYDLWVNCGEKRSSFLVLAAVPENQEFIAVVQIVIVSDADVEAANQILRTFEVVGQQPEGVQQMRHRGQ
jgi:serine protease Do